ncbi:LPS assembly lipoprotein LptE [Salinarimonas sp.]|uniref:LPS assembly lipoprotein LptE n=1 Tax=Salinarimonas sp. TaxID=2766526 RepID=UPI0032D97B5B
MSSPDDRAPTRRLVLAGIAGLAALPLGGCLRPLYAPTASGVGLEDALRAVQVEPVTVAPTGEVLSHHLRQELVFALDGTGRATTEGPKAYRLETNVVVSTRTPIVDATTLRASVATLTGTARYRLATLDGATEIDRGSVQGAVTYERLVQRFATVRAERDAQIRLAKVLADDIRTQVALALRSAPPTATLATGT